MPILKPDPNEANVKRKVLVSAGHTNKLGQDRGAVGGGYVEGVEAVKMRDAIAAKLRERGLEVVEDGADGVNDPLKKALALIAGTHAAIEIHFNAGPTTATGVEVLSTPNRKALAQRIAKAISISTGRPLRGDDGWKSDTSGQYRRLAFCRLGGLIVEVAFISNPTDMRAYSENFEELTTRIAEAIAE